MSLPARYLEVDAELRLVVKDQLTMEGPKSLAPGTPVLITTPGAEGHSFTINGRATGSKRIRTEPELYEVRVRVIHASRDLRLWLESHIGHEAKR